MTWPQGSGRSAVGVDVKGQQEGPCGGMLLLLCCPPPWAWSRTAVLQVSLLGEPGKGNTGLLRLFPVTVGESTVISQIIQFKRRMSSPGDQEVLSLGFSPQCSVGHVGEGMPVEHLLRGPGRALQWERLWQWSGIFWNVLE